MKNSRLRILSTRPVDNILVKEAEVKGVLVDVLSFIETIAIRDDTLRKEIIFYSQQAAIVVFTSMNAVGAVIHMLDEVRPPWKIFCIGNSTRQSVADYFGEENILASAYNGKLLAEQVITWQQQQSQNAPVIFFCGDQRRDEIPGILKDHAIELTEVITYKTIETRHTVTHAYNGILFFSPSAVHSFFKSNQIAMDTVLFAIGETTANTIRTYTNNKIIIGQTPAKEELFQQAVDWLIS